VPGAGTEEGRHSVAIYERDRTPTDRLQGYRVHINPAGSRALNACLSPHLFELFDRTCGKPGRAVHFMTEEMKMLLAFDSEMMRQHDPIAKHRSVSRTITLIGDAIHSMTPYRGIGANVALKDAVRLRDALVAAQRGMPSAATRRKCATTGSTPCATRSRPCSR
jgi:FAD binding domain-containing protein